MTKINLSLKTLYTVPSWKQAVSAREWALCQLIVLWVSEQKWKKKDTKGVPWKWYSQENYQVNC